MKNKESFWHRNNLSITLLVIFLFSLAGQAYTGWASTMKSSSAWGAME